jgi:hypothetical protein
MMLKSNFQNKVANLIQDAIAINLLFLISDPISLSPLPFIAFSNSVVHFRFEAPTTWPTVLQYFQFRFHQQTLLACNAQGLNHLHCAYLEKWSLKELIGKDRVCF